MLYKVFHDFLINGRRIWNDSELNGRAKREFDKITNEGNLMIITPTVMGEVMNLLKPLYRNFVRKKHFGKVSHNDIWRQINKRIDNIFSKYSYERYCPELEVTEKNLEEIKEFYSFFEDKIRAITEKKLVHYSPAAREKKLKYRLFGYMPESADVKLLAEAMFIRQNIPEGYNSVNLFTADADFTEFSRSLETFLFVGVHDLTDDSTEDGEKDSLECPITKPLCVME